MFTINNYLPIEGAIEVQNIDLMDTAPFREDVADIHTGAENFVTSTKCQQR